jgi:hypothetical protein
MKKNQLLFIMLSLFFTSCKIIESNTSKTLDIYGAGVIQNPVLVDLDVKEVKITETSTSNVLTIEELKREAVSSAIKNNKVDVLVEPTFKVVTVGVENTVTVTGYPATYKNFRSIKAEDVPLLQVGISQKAKVANGDEMQNQEKGAGLIILYVIISAALGFTVALGMI